MTLTKESILLITICLADLASTLVLLKHDVAAEGNPLMAFYLTYGVGTFVMVKLTLVILPIFIAEWSRQYRPRFVKLMLRTAIAAYLGVYIGLFSAVNLAPARAQGEAPPQAQAAQAQQAR